LEWSRPHVLDGAILLPRYGNRQLGLIVAFIVPYPEPNEPYAADDNEPNDKQIERSKGSCVGDQTEKRGAPSDPE
jgi:hypothetical protein